MISAYDHGRNPAQHGKQRMIEQQEITMLRESYERELNRIRASAMFILRPEKRAGLIRILNERWDRYNKYVGEVTAWCRDEGIKISADTETVRAHHRTRDRTREFPAQGAAASRRRSIMVCPSDRGSPSGAKNAMGLQRIGLIPSRRGVPC